MKSNYKTEEILEAIELILSKNIIKKVSKKTNRKKEELPLDTEKIILEAENFMKK